MYQHETSVIRVVQIGLGPIGLSATRYLCEHPRLRIVGAIDIDPDKQGKDLGELAGMTSLGLSVCGALDQYPPEVADAAKRRVRFALITGENDCRKGNVMDLFHVGFDKHGFEIKLFVAPRQGHEYRGARFFIKGLEFIEQRKMCARGDSRPTGKIANEAGAFQGGSIPGHPNLMRYLISTR